MTVFLLFTGVLSIAITIILPLLILLSNVIIKVKALGLLVEGMDVREQLILSISIQKRVDTS